MVEAAAETVSLRRRAIAATSRLLPAVHEAGWPIVTVAGAAGLKPGTAQARIADAWLRMPASGLVLDVPTPRALTIAQRLAVPVDDREWLTSDEAADYAGQSVATIGAWRRAGLLPHTEYPHRSLALHLRADIDRVMREHHAGHDVACAGRHSGRKPA